MTTKRWLTFAALQLVGILFIVASQVLRARTEWPSMADPRVIWGTALFFAGWVLLFSSLIPLVIRPRKALLVASAAVGLFLESAAGCVAMSHNTHRPEEWLVLSSPDHAVADARALIATYREDRDSTLAVENLPASLRIAGLRYALLHRDHLDLVMLRQLGNESGYRIWSVNSREHKDRPTRYTDVYYYHYNNDNDESSTNIY